MSLEIKRKYVSPPPTSVVPSTGMDFGKFSSSVPTNIPDYKQYFFSKLTGQNGAKNGLVKSNGPMSGISLTYKDPVTETVGYQSLPYVYVTRQVKESADNLMNFPTEKLPLFMQKETLDQKPVNQDDLIYSILDPVTWNYLHRVNSKNLNEKYNNDAVKCWENWSFQGFGVTDNQMTLKTYNGVYQNRAVVIAKQGYMKITNAWGGVLGGDIRRGTKLWFIVKQKVIPKNTSYEVGATSNDYRIIDIYNDENDDEFAFQIEPYANHKHEIPPMKVLLYDTSDDKSKRGVAIYVGKSDDDESLNDLSSTHHCPNAMSSIPMLMRRGDLQIVLRPNTCFK